jgi:hypothetical protein
VRVSAGFRIFSKKKPPPVSRNRSPGSVAL